MYPLVRAAVFCALLDANLALAMALNSGVKDPWLLLINAVAGAAVGVFAAVAIGWAIRRLHGIGCISAIAVTIGLLVLAAWLAASGDRIAAAATVALVLPLWVCAAAVTALLVKPVHPDR